LKIAETLDPKNVHPKWYLGQAYHRLERWNEALTSYREVMEMEVREKKRLCYAFPEPSSLRLPLEIGNVLLRMERPEEALTILTQGLHAHPSSVELKLTRVLARSLLRTGPDPIEEKELARDFPIVRNAHHTESDDVGLSLEDAEAMQKLADADLYFLTGSADT